MKTKILFSSLVLLLACNIYADNDHKKISELFIAIFKRQFSSRLVKDIVAPHFDKNLREKLPDDLNKTANLTGKLFFFVLSEYLEANENKRNIDFTVYLLPEGYRQGMMRLKNSKLITVKTRLFNTGITERNYLVKVQMGLGVPQEKVIFISMWKRNNKFLITPAQCVLGNKSFSNAAGHLYSFKQNRSNWDEKKVERFAKFLRKIKQADIPISLKGMLCNDFSPKKHLRAHPVICHKAGNYPGGTEIIFVKQSDPEQWLHAVFPKSLEVPKNLKKKINLQGYLQEIHNRLIDDKHSEHVINYKYFVVLSWEYQNKEIKTQAKGETLPQKGNKQ